MATQASEIMEDRRQVTRQRSILAIGKMTVGRREHLCIVRDISAAGMRIETAEIPEPGTSVVVEMLGLNPCVARIAWRKGLEGGLAFHAPQDIDLFGRRSRDTGGPVSRGPRFAIERKGELRVDGRQLGIDLLNISVGGIRGRCAEQVRAHRPGYLSIAGLAEKLAGHVRWNNGEEFGFSFAPALDLSTLRRCCS